MIARQYQVRGLVQGVGFRPYVWRLARELGLAGWVRNDAGGVSLAIAGAASEEFLRRLPAEAPHIARIDACEAQGTVTLADADFRILDSRRGEIEAAIGPDLAACPDCLAELCDPFSRRWRYAFTSCTQCGPRFTASRGLPYDRAQTSFAEFPLCPACAAEYADPADRRFHAETTACPACGPRLRFRRAEAGAWRETEADPLAAALNLLQDGGILGIKGMGGFHLACDARNAEVVAELRRRKQRAAKPFAVMGLHVEALREFVSLDAAECAALESPAAPIVLARKADAELPGVAPGLAELGVMLPSTPLHLLLWHEALGRPAGTAWLRAAHPLLLVMTSANPQGEPIVIDPAEAESRLAGLADGLLLHERAIVTRCDDSVVRLANAQPTFLRRSRGYTPAPIALAEDGPSVLAVGAYLKNTLCVLKGRQAFVSQHIGSLDNAAAVGFLEESIAHWLSILEVRPDLIACDLHPDFPSTRLAERLAAEWGIPCLPIAHHHAHLAAIAAEHGLAEGYVGLALDGVGLGPDGGAWGGELLLATDRQYTRLASLFPLSLPGGDRAAREPWRMAISALHAAGLGHAIGRWLGQTWPQRESGPLLTLLARQLNCPPTSSLGRWFDAVAGVLGVCEISRYEGEAAMLLEALAVRHGPAEAWSDAWQIMPDGRLDLRPVLPKLLALGTTAPAEAAARFHATLAVALAAWLRGLAPTARHVLVGGGCALNGVLMRALEQCLAADGVALYTARQVPPSDGGLALGQAWLARRSFKERENVSGDSGAGG